MLRAHRLLLLVAIIALSSLAALAQDADRDADGIPDDVELKLGTNPDFDEGLRLIVDDKLRGQGDVNGRGPKCPDIDKVYFAHVAGDRYVWKVTFGAEYPSSGTIFHLYTDIDDDTTNGRQDSGWVQGVDIMYSMVDSRDDPRVFTPQVRANQAFPIRYVIRGNAIFVCDDVHMRVVDGKTHFRMWLLSQQKDPQTDGDSTSAIYVDQPLNPAREVPALPYPKPENFTALTMRNFNALSHSLWADDDTVLLHSKDAAVAGYTLLMNGDFVGDGEGVESATWECPVDGEYRIGLILRDNSGRLEGLDVLLSGRKVGTVVGYAVGRPAVLHYTSEPISVKKGQSIQVRTAESSSPVTFHNVCLLASEPAIPPLKIENLTAWHIPDEPGAPPGRVMIAWTTNRPTDGSIRYSLAGPEAYRQNGTIDEDRGPVNNHRVMLPPELGASGYQLRVTCVEPDQPDYQAQTATASYTVWRNPVTHARFQGALTPQVETPVRIPLTVHEPTGLDRDAWPVTSGVPLPDGLLTDPANCRLVDSAGDSVPAQFKATSWWPGTVYVRWLLVDFLADTQAGRDATYTLICGTEPEEIADPIALTSTGLDATRLATPAERPIGVAALPLTINTGRLSLTLGAGGFAPFADVTVDGRRVSDADSAASGFELTDDEGTVYSSALAPPQEIIIEDGGPIRATVAVRGKLVSADGQAYMRYLCRLHFYRGQPYVRTVFSLDNDTLPPTMSLLRSLQVRIPAGLDGARLGIGADGKTHGIQAGDRLLQDEDFQCKTGQDACRRADGWLAAATDDSALAVSVRDFWQLYPKALRTDAEGIVLELLPALPESQYEGASDADVNKLYFWCDKGRYKIRTGVRLTTEFATDFAPSLDGAESPGYASARAWQNPLFAAADTSWYCSTGAFGPMIPREKGKFDVYETRLDDAFGKFMGRRESTREFGFMNYGDWFGERRNNWGNIEYDTQWALGVNFARTGNLDMLWRAEEAESHNADVDVTHYWSNAGTIGRPFTHCIGHTGGYFADDWMGMGRTFNRGPRGAGHTWAQGHFYLHALMGEQRYLETGRLTAENLAHKTTDFRFSSERSAGWPIIALMGAYNVDANPFYLNGARLMADQSMWAVNPETGGWGHFLDPNECKHEPRCWGCKPFMSGVLLHALKMYDLAQPREDIRQTIRGVSDFLWNDTYIARDYGFYYSGCHTFNKRGGTWTLSLVGDGLAYGCLIDPEHAHKDKLLQAAAGFMHLSGVSDFGKTFTQGTCFLPQMLNDLDALGLTDIPAPPPAQSEDRAQLREKLYLTAGETRMFRPVVYHWGTESVPCGVSVREPRQSWFRTAEQGKWTAGAGYSFGPVLTVHAPVDATPGMNQCLPVRVKMGDAAFKFRVVATVVEPRVRGDRVGWLSGEGDPFREAAEALGVTPELIEDATVEDLTQYGTIVLGAEAFNKDFANVCGAAARLEQWVASGGHLVVGQLNDDAWSVGRLPVDLILSDTNDVSAEIVAKQHPLFTEPNTIANLAGVVSYDSVSAAAAPSPLSCPASIARSRVLAKSLTHNSIPAVRSCTICSSMRAAKSEDR